MGFATGDGVSGRQALEAPSRPPNRVASAVSYELAAQWPPRRRIAPAVNANIGRLCASFTASLNAVRKDLAASRFSYLDMGLDIGAAHDVIRFRARSVRAFAASGIAILTARPSSCMVCAACRTCDRRERRIIGTSRRWRGLRVISGNGASRNFGLREREKQGYRIERTAITACATLLIATLQTVRKAPRRSHVAHINSGR